MSKEQTLPANVREQIEREYRNTDLEHPDGSIEFMKTSDKLYYTQLQAAAIRGAEIALENQWIRVEDRLPEMANGATNSKSVNITYNDKVTEGWYCKPANIWLNVWGAVVSPTHWQPHQINR